MFYFRELTCDADHDNGDNERLCVPGVPVDERDSDLGDKTRTRLGFPVWR